MGDINQCAWKMVDSEKFVLGQIADRCGKYADVKVLRPNRKTDLFLCEHHLNEFIMVWGLHNEVEILCRCSDNPDNWDNIGPLNYTCHCPESHAFPDRNCMRPRSW